MEKITKEEIRKLILERGLELTDVIDEVIKLNGIIGVGLITLSEQIETYITTIIKKGYVNYE